MCKIRCKHAMHESVATFICALSKQQHQMAGFAFVNDTDLIVTDDSNDE